MTLLTLLKTNRSRHTHRTGALTVEVALWGSKWLLLLGVRLRLLLLLHHVP